MQPLARSDPAYVASYRLVAVLGGGGMGRVYLGLSRGGHRLAIKVLKEQFASDTQYRERFAKEVAAARLVSPLFTAAVVDADPTAKSPWLATTYIDGPSLEEWITRCGKLDADTTLVLAAGLAEALTSIHAVGLVHRDLKPSNILIDANGPHIIDFGIAMGPDSGLTTANIMIGTPAYMAPERINGGPATSASDIFSLGATLYYAATAITLVRPGTFYEQITQVALGKFNLSKVPTACRPVITRCVGQHPADRPTAAELSQILAGMDVSRPAHGWWTAVGPLPANELPPAPKPSRRKVLAAGAGASLLLAGGVTGTLLWRRSGTPSPVAVEPTMSPEQTPDVSRVIWQHNSGAEPRPGGDGARVLVGEGKVFAASGTTVFASVAGGTRMWTQAMPSAALSLWHWKNQLLVSDLRRFWTLDRLSGKRIKEYPASSVDTYDQVFVIDDFIIARSPTKTLAIEPSGEVCWELSRPADANGRRTPPAIALGASATTVVMRESGTRSRLVLRQLTNSRAVWSINDDLVPQQNQPPGPQDGAWHRSEAVFTRDHLVVREVALVQVRQLANGRLLWRATWKTPIAGVFVFGGNVIIAADRLVAQRIETGDQIWEYPARGARLATDPGERFLFAAHDQGLSALDAAGKHLWTEPHPVRGAVDRVHADEAAVYVTFRPREGSQLGTDVIAYRY